MGEILSGIRECPQESGNDSAAQLRAWIEHIRADVKAGLTPYDSSFEEALRLVDQIATERRAS